MFDGEIVKKIFLEKKLGHRNLLARRKSKTESKTESYTESKTES